MKDFVTENEPLTITVEDPIPVLIRSGKRHAVHFSNFSGDAEVVNLTTLELRETVKVLFARLLDTTFQEHFSEIQQPLVEGPVWPL